MEYVGYNGTISVEGDTLVISRRGLAARTGGLAAGQPRRVPLQAVSDVRLKPATLLANGWLTVGLGGEPASEVGSTTAASDPDTVMFRRKDNDVFGSLHHWLVSVVAYNRDHHIDSAAVQFDRAEPTRLDRLNQRARTLSERRAGEIDMPGGRPIVSAPEQGAAGPAAHDRPPGQTPGWVTGHAGSVRVSGEQRQSDVGRPEQRASARTPGFASRDQLGTPVQPWAKGTVWQNVAGESNYARAFQKLLKRNKARPGEYGTDLDGLPAAVIAEPTNRYDPNAVQVLVQNELVGYLPRDAAGLYSPPLQDLAERGEYLAVTARVWVAPGDDHRSGSVTVVLPPPDGVQSFNEPPEGPHQVIPAGGAIQVTGEESHMDVLTQYLSDRERHLAVTLHIVEEQKTERSQPYRCVEVRLDGRRVGVLTKAMSEEVADLVEYVTARDQAAVCRAVLKGSPLRAELVLHVAKSHEVTRKWLDSVDAATGS